MWFIKNDRTTFVGVRCNCGAPLHTTEPTKKKMINHITAVSKSDEFVLVPYEKLFYCVHYQCKETKNIYLCKGTKNI